MKKYGWQIQYPVDTSKRCDNVATFFLVSFKLSWDNRLYIVNGRQLFYDQIDESRAGG